MKSKNKNNKIISALSLIFILVFIFSLSQIDISKIDAQTSTSKLSGYAWSYTIGWIHFATSTDAQNIVEISSDGYLNGYAWSENIGWIKFGGLEGNTVIGGDTGVTWIARDSNRNWRDLTSSADGTKLAAVVENGKIYTSTDSGATWTARDSDRRWYAITSSADGTKLAAVVYGGQIYTSTNSGVTWTAQNSTTRKWSYIASNYDGTKLFALEQLNGEGATTGQIYRSTDSGITWSAITTGQMYWSSIASSADGMKLVATVYYGGGIYTSVDGGNTWVKRTNAGDRYWGGAVSSLDGTKILATSDGGGKGIYLSKDSGSTWTNLASNITNGTSINWSRVSMSDDGNNLVAVSYYYDGSQNIYTSTNGGSSWTTRTPPGASRQHYWQDSVSSLDGKKLAIVELGGQIYTSVPEPISVTDAKLIGVNLTGWARACAGTINGDCNSDTRTDGWDGWIALSDPTGNEAYGVKFNNPHSSDPSFAWGSDVVGWIDFSGVSNQSSIVNGQCRTYPAGTPQLPSLPGDADLCISGTLSDLTETRITAFNPTVNNPYDYSYSWNCLGISGGTDGLNCSVTTDIQRSSGLGPITIGARLNPSIVNKGQTCQASIVESSNVLDLINASSTCEIYKASDLNTPVDSIKNPASTAPSDWPNVEPGYDYKVVCKDNTTPAQTYISKTLKCLLNPSVKEI